MFRRSSKAVLALLWGFASLQCDFSLAFSPLPIPVPITSTTTRTRNSFTHNHALKHTKTILHMSANSTVTTLGGGNSSSGQSVQLKGSKGTKLENKMPTHGSSGPVVAIHSIDDFLQEIEGAKPNELVVVKFHAKFCKVCARVILKYKKMAHQLLGKDTPVPIKLLSIESTENTKIITELGIKKFPYLQIYRNRECVTSFGTGPAHNFQRAVGGTIDQKLSMTEDEWEAFRSEFKNEIADGLESLERLRLQSVLVSEHHTDMNMDDNMSSMTP